MKTENITKRIALIIFLIFLTVLGLSSLVMIMGYDHLQFHYICYLMKKWGLLPYRDVYDIQYYGIYFYHYLIQYIFGYGDLGFRIFDMINFVVVCASLYFFLARGTDIDFQPTTIYLVLILFTASYYGLGWWWTGQREIFQLPYILWSFYFYKKAADEESWYYPLTSGLLSGFAFFIKPFGGLFLPLFVIIHLIFNYPHNGPFKKRMKIAVLSGAGFCIMIAVFASYLQAIGILGSFLGDSMQLAIEFKKIGFPFFDSLYFIFFRFDPRINDFYIVVYKLFYAAPVIISIIFIIIKIIEKDIKPYFTIIFLFSISFLQILIQKNGNVINHHIFLICFKSILTVLFFYECYGLIEKYLFKKSHTGEYMKQLVLQVALTITIIFLSIPSFIFGFDEYTRKYLRGKLTLQQLQSTKYAMKDEEDKIVDYLLHTCRMNRDSDEILNFNFSQYIPYHSRTKTFNKFINNAFFIITSPDAKIHKKLLIEFLNELDKKPPLVIIANKKDGDWAKYTCFNNWTTSYDQLMKLDKVKILIREKYKTVMETKSLIVFQLK